MQSSSPCRCGPSCRARATPRLWYARCNIATYAELRDRAAAIAAALREGGVTPGNRVAIWLEPGWEAAAAYFGALAAGGVVVVVNEVLRPRQVEHMLSHSGATHFVTTPDLLC